MKLSLIITEYLLSHGMSMTAFAAKAGLSTAYISMLVKGRKGGQIPIPTLDTYKAIASAMDISVDSLLQSCGVISEGFADFRGKYRIREQLKDIMPDANDSQIELFDMIYKMPEQEQKMLLRLAKAMLSTPEEE